MIIIHIKTMQVLNKFAADFSEIREKNTNGSFVYK